MTSPPTDYPESWRPRGAPQSAPSAPPLEPLMMAIDAYLAGLSEEEFQALVARTRG
jgi:hypothetical protein